MGGGDGGGAGGGEGGGDGGGLGGGEGELGGGDGVADSVTMRLSSTKEVGEARGPLWPRPLWRWSLRPLRPEVALGCRSRAEAFQRTADASARG